VAQALVATSEEIIPNPHNLWIALQSLSRFGGRTCEVTKVLSWRTSGENSSG
jgi:hypothetical protein